MVPQLGGDHLWDVHLLRRVDDRRHDAGTRRAVVGVVAIVIGASARGLVDRGHRPDDPVHPTVCLDGQVAGVHRLPFGGGLRLRLQEIHQSQVTTGVRRTTESVLTVLTLVAGDSPCPGSLSLRSAARRRVK